VRESRQRRILLEELRALTSHPTANELYEIVRKRLPRISLGTVYRNLQVLSAAGVIQEIDATGTQKRFDGVTESHYHVRCLRCGRVDDIPVDAIPSLDRLAARGSNYHIMGHRLEFTGMCPDCARECEATECLCPVNRRNLHAGRS